MLAENVEHRRDAVHRQRLAAAIGHRIDHQRQAGDVVEVGMGQEKMIDARQFVDREIPNAGAGIDQNVVVNEQRRGAQVLAADAAATAEDSQFHGRFAGKVKVPGCVIAQGVRP